MAERKRRLSSVEGICKSMVAGLQARCRLLAVNAGWRGAINRVGYTLSASHQASELVHTNRKAHAEGDVSYGVDIAVDGGVAKVHEVTHDRHHGGVHHSCPTQEGPVQPSPARRAAARAAFELCCTA